MSKIKKLQYGGIPLGGSTPEGIHDYAKMFNDKVKQIQDKSYINPTFPKVQNSNVNPYLNNLGNIGGVLNSLLPTPKAYSGEYGTVTQGLDSIYDTASNAVMTANPVIGGVMKAIGGLNKLSDIVGLNTAGKTAIDAFGNSALGLVTGFKFWNKIGAKKSDSFSYNKDLYENIGSSYTGLNQAALKAKDESNIEYGGFSSKQRNKTNAFLNLVSEGQNRANTINQNQQLRQKALPAMIVNSTNNRRLKLNGGIASRTLKVQKGAKIVTDPYTRFLSTLPENLKKPENYNMKRYWELIGKPKNFKEALDRGHFVLENDGTYHSYTVAYNKDTDEYEFMKSKNHPTLQKELDLYNSKEYEDFKSKYRLDTSGEFYKYVRRETPFSSISFIEDYVEDVPEYKEGGSINVIPEGALHAHKHNLDVEGITTKGIPVIIKDGDKITQQAEIEREELILRLEATTQIEDLLTKYNSEDSNTKKEKLATKAGNIMIDEILNNTVDNTNKLL